MLPPAAIRLPVAKPLDLTTVKKPLAECPDRVLHRQVDLLALDHDEQRVEDALSLFLGCEDSGDGPAAVRLAWQPGSELSVVRLDGARAARSLRCRHSRPSFLRIAFARATSSSEGSTSGTG